MNMKMDQETYRRCLLSVAARENEAARATWDWASKNAHSKGLNTIRQEARTMRKRDIAAQLTHKWETISEIAGRSALSRDCVADYLRELARDGAIETCRANGMHLYRHATIAD